VDNVSTAGKLKSLRTQHQATQAELEKYKLLVDSVQDYAIFLMDTNGYIQTWNRGAERNKGYKPEDIIGKHFSTFYLERDKQAKKPERELELAKKFGRVEDEDWRIRKDGTKFWANVVITALYENDELVGFAKVTRDLTERKKQEDTLREANALLRNQQKELERLSMSKDEFISLASHQLRTPATATKQLIGLLLEGFKGDVDPDQKEVLQKAYESNERQIAIVNSLLRVAQIDGGKVILHKEPTDVAKLIQTVVDEQADTFKSRDQIITIKIPSDIPQIVVDPEHFGMALGNLVDNASKYTQEGGKLSITAKSVGDSVAISFQDTGVGIADEDLHKLFTKFSRIPNELSQKAGGSGLGLYWVSKVVELHDGKLAVNSEVDTGTTFTVTVPIKDRDA
jgi:osomolarity two-component system sensor histidine kinase TcsA